MKAIFADTFYWVALTNRFDQWHERVVAFSQTIGHTPLVTTDLILAEFLAHYSSSGPHARLRAAGLVRSLFDDPDVEVVELTRAGHLAALDLYESRPDKAYSLTDCHAMTVMREKGIDAALTHDAHFAQEGFTV